MYFRSGSGIPQIGRYGGLRWRMLVSGYVSTSRILLGTEFWASKALRDQTIDDYLDASNTKHKH